VFKSEKISFGNGKLRLFPRSIGESGSVLLCCGTVSDFFVLLLLGSDCLSCWVCFGFWFRFCDDDGLKKFVLVVFLRKVDFFLMCLILRKKENCGLGFMM